MIFRTIRTKPKNDQFFKTYASLLFVLSAGLLLTQLISGATESNAIYMTIRESLALMPKFTKTIVAWIGTIMGVLLIEQYGVRILLPYSIDAIIYKKFKGEEKYISIFSITLCLVIYAGSFYLSVHGGKDYADKIIVENEQSQNQKRYSEESNNESDKSAELKKERQLLYDSYISDSLALASSYNSKINQQRNILNKTKYGKKYREIKAEIDRLNVENAQSMLELKNKFNEDWREQKELISKKYEKMLDSKQKSVEPIASFTKKQGKQMKSYTVIFVICCMLFQLFSSIIMRIILKGSGIEEQAVVSQSWFDSPKYAEWLYIANQRFDSIFKNRIRGFDSKTKLFDTQHNNNGYERHTFDTQRVSSVISSVDEKLDNLSESEANQSSENDDYSESEANQNSENEDYSESEANQFVNIVPRRTITKKIEHIDVELKQCAVCSEFFASKRGTHKYCSQKCKVLAGNMSRKKKRLNGHDFTNQESQQNEQLVNN